MKHLSFLTAILTNDEKVIREKEHEYNGSWKKRGGVGAFFSLVRKWDRIESKLQNRPSAGGNKWDIFAHIAADKRDEGLIDDIRDLRRYLTLVEAEMATRGGLGDKK